MILKTMLTTGGKILTMDTIVYEGEPWLVPDWILSPDDKRIRPLRIIALRTMAHQPTHKSSGWDFVVTHPVPKSVLLGHPPEGKEKLFVIHENPEIWVLNPDVLN